MPKVVLTFLAALLLWAGALGIRRAVYHQQSRSQEGEVPFLMESALQFRMTKIVAEEGKLPKQDPDVQIPEGVEFRKTYSVGAEQWYAGIAALLPKSWSFAERVRWASAGLFSLAIPFAAMWAWKCFGSLYGGLACGCLLAVSPAFAVRSSGLELSRENLAFPFLCLFLWMMEASRQSESPRGRWIRAGMASLALALAQVYWDLSQVVPALWILWVWGRSLFGKLDDAETPVILLSALTLGLASLINPYLRSHGFLFSPVYTLIAVRAVTLLVPLQGKAWRIGLPLGLFFAWQLLGGYLIEGYSHFSELFVAKIRFGNVKPEDPALLNYSQRIMWTPALHSATKALTKAYFPISLLLLGCATIRLLWVAVSRKEHRGLEVLIWSWISLLFYVFFFRFHVFLILFAACAIAALCSSFRDLKWTPGRHLFPLLLISLFTWVEVYHLLFFEPPTQRNPQQEQLRQLFTQLGADMQSLRSNRWGRAGGVYVHTEDLLKHMEALPEEGPVLAHFGISGNILEGVGFPIVLHPKFEGEEIRERVRLFYEHLFLKDEKALRDWALSFGARYYVHSNGALSEHGDLRMSPRYMVDAMEPPAEAAVHVLENDPMEATWFQPLGGNAKYRIYRILSDEDEVWAGKFTQMALMARQRGDVEGARRFALQALEYHWKYQPAQNVLGLLQQDALPRGE